MGIFSIFRKRKKSDQHTAWANTNALLVDVRSTAEYAKGSVKGAINIPLDRLLKELELFKGKEKIILFCRSGSRSAMGKALLEQNGFTNVINGGTWENVQQALDRNKV